MTDSPSLSVLRTAAGSPPTISQYRKLQSLGVRVVAADANSLSVGFYFADKAYCVPRVNAPDYLDKMVEICAQEKIDWFLPALDEELELVTRAHDSFVQVGTRVLASDHKVIRICTDKLATAQFFQEQRIPTPTTQDSGRLVLADVQSYPQIVKPRFGRGSKHVFVARNAAELDFFCRYVPGAVVQDFIRGVEYTIDVLSDFASEPIIVSPRRRVATDSGISSKGIIDWNPAIIAHAKHIVRTLGLIGPANIQCIVDDSGDPFFTEINARLAGSAILSDAAGVPLMQSIVSLMRGEPVPEYIGPPRELVMLRYWAEVYLDRSAAVRFGWNAK